MFFAALFTIAKIWKQLKCPLIGEWKKIIYICVCMCIYIYTHTHTYVCMYIHLNISQPKKKNEILPFLMTWMDPEGIMLSEVSQTKTNTI